MPFDDRLDKILFMLFCNELKNVLYDILKFSRKNTLSFPFLNVRKSKKDVFRYEMCARSERDCLPLLALCLRERLFGGYCDVPESSQMGCLQQAAGTVLPPKR